MSDVLTKLRDTDDELDQVVSEIVNKEYQTQKQRSELLNRANILHKKRTKTLIYLKIIQDEVGGFWG